MRMAGISQIWLHFLLQTRVLTKSSFQELEGVSSEDRRQEVWRKGE